MLAPLGQPMQLMFGGQPAEAPAEEYAPSPSSIPEALS